MIACERKGAVERSNARHLAKCELLLLKIMHKPLNNRTTVDELHTVRLNLSKLNISKGIRYLYLQKQNLHQKISMSMYYLVLRIQRMIC